LPEGYFVRDGIIHPIQSEKEVSQDDSKIVETTFVRAHEPPLSKESKPLELQLRIIVPSTFPTNVGGKCERCGDCYHLTPEQFEARVEEVESDLAKIFNGETSVRGVGGYISCKGVNRGELIKEQVAIIEANMTPEQYREQKKRIEDYIRTKREEWGQETLMYGFEDQNFIYPNLG
jgi:hypothetical protein